MLYIIPALALALRLLYGFVWLYMALCGFMWLYVANRRFYQFVVPAKAGIQFFMNHLISFIQNWIPTCAGMTHFGLIEVP